MMSNQLQANYRLKIYSLQKCDGEIIENELEVMAAVREMRNKTYIFYKEYQEEGDVLECRLTIAPEEIELRKDRGASILRFMKGNRQECYYQSPVGPMILESETLHINKNETEENLVVDMKYNLYMAGNLLSEYELKINLLK